MLSTKIGNLHGKKYLRGTKLTENEFNQGAEIWILNDKSELLITQRAKNKSHALKWEVPGRMFCYRRKYKTNYYKRN